MASRDVDYIMQFLPHVEADTWCPTADDLAHILRKVHSSAPEPDGIDYSAWKLDSPFTQESIMRGVQHAW